MRSISSELPLLHITTEKEDISIVGEIRENVNGQLMVVLEDFAGCFEKWIGSWDICVWAQDEYFEDH